MSINVFFLLILTLLIGMFSYFKPTHTSQIQAKEVPQFELDNFVIYEISPTKIVHFFEGEHGKRFEDRYEVSLAKFSNNEKALFESIAANQALYKNDVVTLDGDVHYVRSDGLEFRSQEGVYNQALGFVQTSGPFSFTQAKNSVQGVGLYYDLNLETVNANQVRGVYQLH